MSDHAAERTTLRIEAEATLELELVVHAGG
jgi:hypothetical protein